MKINKRNDGQRFGLRQVAQGTPWVFLLALIFGLLESGALAQNSRLPGTIGNISGVANVTLPGPGGRALIPFCWKGQGLPAPAQLALVAPTGPTESSHLSCQSVAPRTDGASVNCSDQFHRYLTCSIDMPGISASTRYQLASREPGAGPRTFVRFTGQTLQVLPARGAAPRVLRAPGH
jgi:hypothetical protein